MVIFKLIISEQKLNVSTGLICVISGESWENGSLNHSSDFFSRGLFFSWTFTAESIHIRFVKNVNENGYYTQLK